MTFREYQKEALVTAKFKDKHALPYLRLGLISEVGELAGKVKKWIRDNGADPAQLPKQAILDECGDVLWYLAVYDNYQDEGHEDDQQTMLLDIVMRGVNPTPTRYLAETLSTHCHTLSCWSNNFLDGTKTVVSPVACLSSILSFIGESPESAAIRNIQKLRDRQSRGVIGGSGDNR